MARRWPRSANRCATSRPRPPVPPVITLTAFSTSTPSLLVILPGRVRGIRREGDAGSVERGDHLVGFEGPVHRARAAGGDRPGDHEVSQGGRGKGGRPGQCGEPAVVAGGPPVAGGGCGSRCV